MENSQIEGANSEFRRTDDELEYYTIGKAQLLHGCDIGRSEAVLVMATAELHKEALNDCNENATDLALH
ncbi:MAG: hypothetical protein CL912_16605 [Deltaproteobacteria bacterium]|nr:hypothetical protein [Deltaproteobacteria bacterium]|tara:strand:- start:546 stop:752 length:207 start_codon:yes stop_codon:yes gene_type:complete